MQISQTKIRHAVKFFTFDLPIWFFFVRYNRGQSPLLLRRNFLECNQSSDSPILPRRYRNSKLNGRHYYTFMSFIDIQHHHYHHHYRHLDVVPRVYLAHHNICELAFITHRSHNDVFIEQSTNEWVF